MARFDYLYLKELMASHLALSASLVALTIAAVSAGLWHFRPYYNRGDVRSGLALLALCFVAYALGSYVGNHALHIISLIGIYLGFVTVLAGKAALVSVGPPLLAVVAIFTSGFFEAPTATALEVAAVAAMTGYIVFVWRTRGAIQPVCGHCFESKLSRQRYCLHCGRRIEGDEIPFPKSMLAYGGVISAVIVALSLVTFPVLVSTPTGLSYTNLGINGAASLVPLWSLNSTSPSPQFESVSNYQGLGQVYVYSDTQSTSNTTLWTVVSFSRLSNAQLLVIFPGFSSNLTQTASSNTTSGYTWKYRGTSYIGSIGSASAYTMANGTVNKVFVTYLAGIAGHTSNSLPQSDSQLTLLVSDRISAATNFGFLHQAYVALAANSQYLESAASIVLLFGVVRTARSRDVNFAKAMENAQGLPGNELELLLAAVSSGKSRTGKEILGATESTLRLGWYELLPSLLKFQELGLLEARVSSDRGVPTLKWNSRFR